MVRSEKYQKTVKAQVKKQAENIWQERREGRVRSHERKTEVGQRDRFNRYEVRFSKLSHERRPDDNPCPKSWLSSQQLPGRTTTKLQVPW